VTQWEEIKREKDKEKKEKEKKVGKKKPPGISDHALNCSSR
jgi:hypothetical protein